jgi:hypothetical protein
MSFKSILDPEFKYRNAASTDLRKTFERIRKEQRVDQERSVANDYGSPGSPTAGPPRPRPG